MLTARILGMNDAHVRVGFYSGDRAGALAHNGVLIFGRAEWDREIETVLAAAGLLPAERHDDEGRDR